MNAKRLFKFSKPMVFLLYLVIWGIEIATFWLTEDIDCIGYSLFTFYLVLPLITLLLSIHIGRDKTWGKFRWLMILFFGFMYLLAPYVTFSLANMLSFSKTNYPELRDFLIGGFISALGLVLGSLMRKPVVKMDH